MRYTKECVHVHQRRPAMRVDGRHLTDRYLRCWYWRVRDEAGRVVNTFLKASAANRWIKEHRA